MTYNRGFFLGPGFPFGFVVLSDIGVDLLMPATELFFLPTPFGVLSSCVGAGVLFDSESCCNECCLDCSRSSVAVGVGVGVDVDALWTPILDKNFLSLVGDICKVTTIVCFFDALSTRPLRIGVEGMVTVVVDMTSQDSRRHLSFTNRQVGTLSWCRCRRS